MSVRYVKCAIMMKFLYKDSKVFQYFIIVDSKYKKYVLQNRYELHRKFEEAIERNALSLNDDRYLFINRKDEDDRVVLEFSCSASNVDKKPTGYFAIVGDVPYSDGCEECQFRVGNICTKKNKEIEKMLKNCKFFLQRENK